MTDKQMNTLFDQKEKIAERLRAAREALEITQTELAKRSGVGRSAIGHYENGKAFPGGLELIKLSQALDVTPNYILSGSEQFRESQEPESALVTDDFMTLLMRVSFCMMSLSSDVRESVSGLLMSLVRQKLSKKDYENFATMIDDLIPAMKEAGFDLEKLFTQMDKDIDQDKLTKRLENQIKE